MNMRKTWRCILITMGVVTVCAACTVRKNSVDSSGESGTKIKSFGEYNIMRDGVKVIIPEMENMYM